ncbi:MAG TPA: Fic family protein [Puia sp.]|nr:Fic family protein [Puia sp.]
MELTPRKKQIVDIILEQPDSGITAILKELPVDTAVSTLNRDLKALVDEHVLIKNGQGRSTVYSVHPGYQLVYGGIGDSYFDKDLDERKGKKRLDPDIFFHLEKIPIFTPDELHQLETLQTTFQERIRTLPEEIVRKERNRLSIELSWKSSQIEGNTYSLLETEVLLSENIPAEGKEKSEAMMLINHKRAMDYIYEQRIQLTPLRTTAIENIHSLLLDDLGVSKNIRKRIVGITGTSYTPPDNEFQIREHLERACEVINHRSLIPEKALLAVLFISYIQPFEDGNKRTGRITGNGILIENGYCPLSYRSVKPVDYKKAMILFYEQNSIAAYKNLFIDQFAFAVNNYFR